MTIKRAGNILGIFSIRECEPDRWSILASVLAPHFKTLIDRKQNGKKYLRSEMKITSHCSSNRKVLAFFFLGTVLLCTCSLRHQELYPIQEDSPMRIDGKLDFVRIDDSVVGSINIEIADTPETQIKGLMGRTALDYTEGMLFVFERVRPQNFLMKNTLISLDIIFIGKDGCVVNIAESTTPMSDTVYRSKEPIKYVVEVKAGFAKCFKIEKGTCIKWRRL